MNSNEIPTYMYLPKGEWLPIIEAAFKVAGIVLVGPTQGGFRREVDGKLPISFSIARPFDIIENINDPRDSAKASFTGTDVICEKQAKTDWLFPLFALEPENIKFGRPELYVGTTPRRTGAQPPKLEELNGKTVMTSYKRLATEWLRENGCSATVEYRAGAVEGYWFTRKDVSGVVDIALTGKSQRQNGIIPIATIMYAELGLVKSSEINRRDQERIEDLREALYLSAQKGGEEK